VLDEKPLSRTAAESQELIALARKMGRVLAVGHVFLFNPGIRAVREVIRSGGLGRLYYLNAVRTNLGPVRRDVNALWDLAAHDLSIFDYWLGSAPLSVTAHGESYLNQGVEDVVTAAFRYPDGVAAHVHASWLNPRKVREITVVGEKAMAVWNDMDLGEPVRVYYKGVEADQRYADSFGTFQMLIRQGDVVIPHVSGPEPLAAEGAHFIECIRGGAEPINGGEVGLTVVRALEAADRSIEAGSLQVPVNAG
jgi:predicted dehydrogenase